jgi:thiamine monophosphate synthase
LRSKRTHFFYLIHTINMHRDKMEQNRTKNNPALIMMSDESQDPYTQLELLPQNHIFIFRHYRHKNRATLALELARAAKAKKLVFLVAGDEQLAFRLGALCAGVHFPEWQIWRRSYLIRKQPRWIISAACHSLPALRRAALLNADFAILSPVFAPRSYQGRAKKLLGICPFVSLARSASLPVFALGGMTPARARRLGVGFAAVSVPK